MTVGGGEPEPGSHPSSLASCSSCERVDTDDLRTALRVARRSGGSLAEIFVEHRDSLTLRTGDGSIEGRADRDVGAAVRVLAGGRVGYASTNVLTRAGLAAAADMAGAITGGSDNQRHRGPALTERQIDPAHRPLRPAPGVEATVKADLVRRAAEAARAAGRRIRHVTVTYVDVTQHVIVATSDGELVRDARTRTRMTCRVVARDQDRSQAGFEGPGIGGGLELFDEHSPEQIGAAAAARALRMLEGASVRAGEMPVVLGQAGGGLLLHEACGHGLEADGLARRTSIYARSTGERLAGQHVTVVDHPGRPAGFGSYGADDEGRPSRPTVLIDRGVQTGAMTDMVNAQRLAVPGSANGRRESYAHPPLCRMSNTYFQPGEGRPEEIVADVPRGLYVARLSGGDVNTTTGDFAFTTSEAYLIENGSLTRPVSGATILGNGPRALAAIDAVGDDLAFTQAMCGKDSQWVPVSYGSPTIRILGLTVTGEQQ